MSKRNKHKKSTQRAKHEKQAQTLKAGLPPLFWAILCLALLIKAAYLALAKNTPFFEPLLLDPAYYHQWALKIAKGDLVGEGVFYGLPLYPYFLGLCYKFFGDSFLTIKIIQALLGLVTIFFIYKTGEKIASQRVGLVAAFMAALYGPLFFHEEIFIPEVLSLPLYAAGFYLTCLFVERPTVRKGVGLGILLGLAALTKAGILLFVLLFPVVYLASRRGKGERKIAPLLAVIAVFFLTLAPAALHNIVYGKDSVLLTSHSGFNFYVGNNPKANGTFAPPEGIGNNVDAQREDSRNLAEKELGKSLKPSEVSKYWSDKAWVFIKENPGQFLRLCARKMAIFFDAREVSDVQDYVFARNFNPLLKVPWLNFMILGPLFLLGLTVFFKALRHRFLVLLWVGSYLVGVIAFFVNARYRLPLFGIFFPVAAMGAVGLYERLKTRSWVNISWCVVVLTLGIFITQVRLVDTNWSKDNINVGDVYLKKKDYEGALVYYKKALEIEPDSSKANLSMGLILTKLARYEEAKEYYLRSIEANPNNLEAHNNLGLWYDRDGNLEEARRCFLKALQINPNSAQAHNNLGMVYGKEGEYEKAIEAFEASLKLNPGFARAYTNLGLVYYRQGRPEDARRMWEKALEVDPQFEEAKRALNLLQNKR